MMYIFCYGGGIKGVDRYVNGTGYNGEKRMECCL